MHPAVVQGDAVLTYGELLTKSRELAGKLTSGTGQSDQKPRGVESLTEMVGCILAERPFLPVTPDSTIDPATLPVTPEGCGYLLTTSGTSGEPKVVVGSRSGWLATYSGSRQSWLSTRAMWCPTLRIRGSISRSRKRSALWSPVRRSQ